MKAFSFNVTIAASALDTEVVEDTIRQALVDGLPEETLTLVKSDGVKSRCSNRYVKRKSLHNYLQVKSEPNV
jgi:hypothetical protein